MSIGVRWGNPAQTIIHLEFKRGWKWQDVYAALQQADDMITSVEHVVHLLIDVRGAGGIPVDFMTVAGDMFAQGSARPNEGKRVVVGAGTLGRLAYNGLASAFSRQLKNRAFLFASSMDEAQDMLGTP